MLINDTITYVGTSGYNYEDWKGTFVPEKSMNFDILTHYVKTKMNFLELTYTFYKLPEADKVAGIMERLGEGVKASMRLTKTLMRKKPDLAEIEGFKEGIKPALESGKLVALFADFHNQFTASRENFDILLSLKDSFGELPLFIELTNSTWHKERIYEEVKAAGLGLVITDGACFKGFAPYHPICSGNNVYFRLHGRNPMWLNHNDKMLEYSYSTDELKRFLRDALGNSVFAKNIFFSFCNVEKGNAPKNALELISLIEASSQG